jgi:sulfonate transport system substrate-binding protein
MRAQPLNRTAWTLLGFGIHSMRCWSWKARHGFLRDGTGLAPNYTFLFAHQRFAKEHPELIAVILQELKAVDDWANANASEVASLLSKDLGVGIAPLERATGRREYGVRPIDEQIVKDQQHLADVFFRLGEIPKQIRVEDAVILNAPWWTRDLADRKD